MMSAALSPVPGRVARLQLVLLCLSVPRMGDAGPAPLAPPVPGSRPAPVRSPGGLVRAIDRLYHGGGRVGYLVYLDAQRFQLDLERDGAPRRGCVYRGTVDSKPESLAVFNMCQGGLNGFFAVNRDRYKIRPVARAAGHGKDTERALHRYTWESFSFEAVMEHESCGTRDPRGREPRRTARAQGEVTRRRRSVSRARHVELLLVADASMVKKYGDELQHYLLTLASIAARLYGHASIENPIRLSVVKLTVLTDDEKGLDVSKNAAATLKSFCKWQNQQNPLGDDHHQHHDAAILFTRQVKTPKKLV